MVRLSPISEIDALVAAAATSSMLLVSFESKCPGLLPIQIRGGQPQVVRKHVAPQSLDHLAAHPARIIVGDEVADAAQREQHDDRDRHLPKNFADLS